jgi:hypothetical protein
MRLDYCSAPSPHLVIPQVLPTELYAQLRFPHLDEAPRGRTGRDLFPGEPGWARTMAQPGWAELGETMLGEPFIRRVIGLFADDIRSRGALIDPDRVYLDRYAETRAELKKPTLDEGYDPNALFVRFDFQAMTSTHWTFVHTDWNRRVVGGVLFMTSAADAGMEGGEFGLFSDQEFRNDRTCHAPRLEKAFAYEHNKGVLLLNCNGGFHGPLPIRRLAGTRKWIYYAISSRRNVWPVAQAVPA